MIAKLPALGIVISGRGSNMAAIVRAAQCGALPARIAVVIADRAAAGLELAQALGITTETIPAREFADRTAFDAALAAALDQHGADFIALAGFMRILGAVFVGRYRGRLINIHPSLLPQHKGLHTHAQVLAAGDASHGASVHFVTPDLDGGPVIAQASLQVQPADTASSLSARVQQLEHMLYPKVCGWVASGRVQLDGDRVLFDGLPLDQPLIDSITPRTRHAGGAVC
ncbi:MAG: phosphoribosylglycinamide formyltransferase [Proteobacteria bacterium]|nr:phosphoribosylglycinamide formyltransferase [Pseudomonadota bacterium]